MSAGWPTVDFVIILVDARRGSGEIICVGRTALDSSGGDSCPGTRFGGRNAAQFKVPRVGNMHVPCQHKGLGAIGAPTNGSAVLKLTLNQQQPQNQTFRLAQPRRRVHLVQPVEPPWTTKSQHYRSDRASPNSTLSTSLPKFSTPSVACSATIARLSTWSSPPAR